jgi:hypothetical protein
MITLEEGEADALARLALAEMRDPREQVRYLVRQELIRLGMVKPDPRPEAFEHRPESPA